MYHEITFPLFFTVFLFVGLSSFFLLHSVYYHTGQIDFDIADTSNTQDAFHI